jgi:hypothetical protein
LAAERGVMMATMVVEWAARMVGAGGDGRSVPRLREREKEMVREEGGADKWVLCGKFK